MLTGIRCQWHVVCGLLEAGAPSKRVHPIPTVFHFRFIFDLGASLGKLISIVCAVIEWAITSYELAGA